MKLQPSRISPISSGSSSGRGRADTPATRVLADDIPAVVHQDRLHVEVVRHLVEPACAGDRSELKTVSMSYGDDDRFWGGASLACSSAEGGRSGGLAEEASSTAAW
jgi:hypothetical protein